MVKELIRFVINPHSGGGSGAKYGKIIENLYSKEGIVYTEGSDSAFTAGAQAVLDGVTKLILVCGDGTAHQVVNGLFSVVKSPQKIPALGFIWAGTANNFAKNSGIPKNFWQAINLVKNGKIIPVDLGKITWSGGERYFINTISTGFDAAVVRSIEKNGKNRVLPKNLSYLTTALKELFFNLRTYNVSISNSEISLKKDIILIAVTIGPTYGGIFMPNPEAKMADGNFDACVIGKLGNPKELVVKLKALRMLLRATKGTHIKAKEVSAFKSSYLKISSEEPLILQFDGEDAEALGIGDIKECDVSLIHNGLNIIVPQALDAIKVLGLLFYFKTWQN
jgi:diacylglycerol kinase (ATP)